MIAPEVYFADRRASSHHESLVKKVGLLFDRVGVAKMISPGDLVAVKLHFGERGSTAFINPVFVRKIVERVKSRRQVFCVTAIPFTPGALECVDHQRRRCSMASAMLP